MQSPVKWECIIMWRTFHFICSGCYGDSGLEEEDLLGSCCPGNHRSMMVWDQSYVNERKQKCMGLG